MEKINLILSGIFLPATLFILGVYFLFKLKFFYILHPIKLFRSAFASGEGEGRRPFVSLSNALAGTLGVGNMAGVATAIVAGGAGAIFWMWISAFLAMGIKYAEVWLALETRVKKNGEWRGGAMYYIKSIFKNSGLAKISYLFSILCALNALLTGNIVQVNSAAAALPGLEPLVIGAFIGAAAVYITAGGGRRVSRASATIIPVLSVVYIAFSLAIIFNNISRIPEVLCEIFRGAFSMRSVGGGIFGYIGFRAMRFGVTRGIFSNEAGCGTSPIAHAEANVKSSHNAGCLGVLEVFFDTVVLCTLTGFVILLAPENILDGIPLTIYAFSSLAGDIAGKIMSLCVVFFAFAAVISQSNYGLISLEYLGGGRIVKNIYLAMIFICSVMGSVINAIAMWQLADFIISLMTVLNVLCLLIYYNKRKNKN